MRAFVGLAVLTVIVMGLVTYSPSTGSEGVAPPPQPAAPAHEFDEAELQALRQQYVALAEKRVESMSGPELLQGIAEIRRQDLLVELANLASESQEGSFEQARAYVALTTLGADTPEDLKTLLASLPEQWKVAMPTFR